jgi:hypothetical protein
VEGDGFEPSAKGPLAHLTTLNPNGSPQVTVVWVGIDGEPTTS